MVHKWRMSVGNPPKVPWDESHMPKRDTKAIEKMIKHGEHFLKRLKMLDMT